MSSNYLSIRFRKEASFTVSDVERIGAALEFDPGEFLGDVEVGGDALITRFPTARDGDADALDDEAYAANTDDSMPDESEHNP